MNSQLVFNNVLINYLLIEIYIEFQSNYFIFFPFKNQ